MRVWCSKGPLYQVLLWFLFFFSRTAAFGLSHVWNTTRVVFFTWLWMGLFFPHEYSCEVVVNPPHSCFSSSCCRSCFTLARVHVTAKHCWCALGAASWPLRPPVVCWTCLHKQLVLISEGKCRSEGWCRSSGEGTAPLTAALLEAQAPHVSNLLNSKELFVSEWQEGK